MTNPGHEMSSYWTPEGDTLGTTVACCEKPSKTLAKVRRAEEPSIETGCAFVIPRGVGRWAVNIGWR